MSLPRVLGVCCMTYFKLPTRLWQLRQDNALLRIVFSLCALDVWETKNTSFESQCSDGATLYTWN